MIKGEWVVEIEGVMLGNRVPVDDGAIVGQFQLGKGGCSLIRPGWNARRKRHGEMSNCAEIIGVVDTIAVIMHDLFIEVLAKELPCSLSRISSNGIDELALLSSGGNRSCRHHRVAVGVDPCDQGVAVLREVVDVQEALQNVALGGRGHVCIKLFVGDGCSIRVANQEGRSVDVMTYHPAKARQVDGRVDDFHHWAADSKKLGKGNSAMLDVVANEGVDLGDERPSVSARLLVPKRGQKARNGFLLDVREDLAVVACQ